MATGTRSRSMDHVITSTYTDGFSGIKSHLIGADKAKKKLQMVMWNHQQDIIIKARRNIHITNSAMNGRYANLDTWETFNGT